MKCSAADGSDRDSIGVTGRQRAPLHTAPEYSECITGESTVVQGAVWSSAITSGQYEWDRQEGVIWFTVQ